MLVAQYRDDALRLARRLTGRYAEAEDLAQSAVFRVLRRAEFIEDPTRVRSYLLTTVRNLWRNELRDRAHRRDQVGWEEQHDPAAPDAGPEERVLLGFDAQVVLQAYRLLGKKSQEIIWLPFVEMLDYDEIAQRLDISPGAARQRVHRARTELASARDEIGLRTSQMPCSVARTRMLRNLDRGAPDLSLDRHLQACASCRAVRETLGVTFGAEDG